VALLGILTGILISYRIGLPPKLESRRHTVATARVMVLVDTPRSLVIDLASRSDVATLSDKARVLANLVTRSPLKERIADLAGVPRDMLVPVRERRLGRPVAEGPNVTGAVIGQRDRRAYVLRAIVPTLVEGDTPIVEVQTQAPDIAGAVRLANASIAGMQSQLALIARRQAVPPARRVVLRQQNPPLAQIEQRGPSTRLAVIGGAFAFLVGCLMIVAVGRVRRRLRALPRRTTRTRLATGR
jgi:hypothetical protein